MQILIVSAFVWKNVSSFNNGEVWKVKLEKAKKHEESEGTALISAVVLY